MVNNSRNINQANNQPSSQPLNTKKETMTYGGGNPGPVLLQAQQCVGL